MDAQSHNHKTDTTGPRSGQQIINNARPFASLGLDITRCFVWIRDNLTLTDWNAWALPYIEGIQNAPGPDEVPQKVKPYAGRCKNPMQKKQNAWANVPIPDQACKCLSTIPSPT